MNVAAPTWTLVNSYPFRQPERVYFNPNNLSEMWVTSFGNGMKMGVLSPLGIVKPSEEDKLITVFPNPFNEQITFTNLNPNRRIIKVNMYDSNGRLLISKQDETNFINATLLGSGVYVLEFVFNNHSIGYKKIVK